MFVNLGETDFSKLYQETDEYLTIETQDLLYCLEESVTSFPTKLLY